MTEGVAARLATVGRPLVRIIDAEESARDLYGDWFVSLGLKVMCAVGVFGLSCSQIASWSMSSISFFMADVIKPTVLRGKSSKRPCTKLH